MSIAAPGWTMVPNDLLDSMDKMTDAELRVALAIVRKTIGYHKHGPEPVSYTQLQKITGLSRQGVKLGLDRTIQRGIVKKSAQSGTRNVNRFTLDISDSGENTPPEDTQDQSTALTSESATSLPSRPELVYPVDTQNKCIKDKSVSGAKKTAPDGAAKPPRQRTEKQLALDAMKDAIAEAFGLDHDKVTASQWSEFGRAGRELLDVGAKPDDMRALHQWCMAQKWKGKFSSVAMAKNWANFEKQRQHGQESNLDPAAFRRETAASAAERAMYGESEAIA